MKPREYDSIKKSFVKEQKRWKSLKVGDIVYEAMCAGMEFEYAKMVIKKINIEERKIIAEDVSGNHRATLTAFMTENEFKKLR